MLAQIFIYPKFYSFNLKVKMYEQDTKETGLFVRKLKRILNN